MYSKKYALAARETLELWRKGLDTSENVYSSLYNALWENDWEQLAEQLRLWAQEGKDIFKMFKCKTVNNHIGRSSLWPHVGSAHVV